MRRIIKKKFRKFWKSVINRRLVKYASRFSLAVFILTAILSFGKIQGTNSFFTDTANVTGNTLSAGYWIPPTISISSPAGGEEWQVGSSHNILWSAASADPAATAGMDIDLDYSCDGDPWQTIIHNTGNDGTQSWTIPADVSDNCRVRVAAADSYGLTNSVESNTFEISWMIVLNEFMPKPATGLKEWVEIYNKGSVPVDVNGWKIKDELNQSRVIDSSHTNTGSTIINPGVSRFLVVQNYDSFYLNDDGDTIKLYDALNNLLDSHTYAAGDVSVGKTIARSPDGVGNWIDPVPTPGEKNDPSNDIKDFQKYYRKVCFDKNDKPLCDLKFLRSIGILDEKSEVVEPAEAEEIAENNPAENGESENPIDQGGSDQEEVTPADEVAADPAVEDNEPAAEAEDEPKIIKKEFDIKLSGKLNVPDGFEADMEQKMKKIELIGEEKIINDLKDFEIDLSKIEIRKEGKIEITVGDLDLPKDVKVLSHESGDVVLEITVSEKKEDSQDSGKDDDKSEVKPGDNGAALKPDSSSAGTEEKDEKDDKKDGGDGSGDKNSNDSKPGDNNTNSADPVK